MSTNIHFAAKREIAVLRTGKIETQRTVYGGTWQTSSSVTNSIITHESPIQAYKDWVLAHGEDWLVAIHEDEDFFQEKSPIAYEKVNIAEDHIKEFDEWLAEMQQEGWDIEIEAW